MHLKLVSGKTYTTLTALTHLLVKHKDLVGLVVVPAKALKVFRKELKEKLNVSFSEFSTQNKELKQSRIILVSHTAIKDFLPNIQKLVQSGYKLAMILDEAHVCQAEDNNFTKLILGIRRYFPIFWALTATPMGNDVWGLYNLMYLINPNILGTKEEFKEKYLLVENKPTKVFNKYTKRYDILYREVIVGYKDIKQVHNIVKDYLILKQRKYNLRFHYHKTRINETEFSSYKKAAQGLARKTSAKNFAVRVNDLQRVVDNSSETFSDTHILSSKEKLFVEVLIKEIKNHAIIVYTELADNIERLKLIITLLKKAGHPIGTIHEITGTQSFKDRAKVEDTLKKHDVILITQAGTESINLQAADTIFLYNTPFSIKVFIQLVGRVTRLDTKHAQQHIHFIEAEGTVDTYRRLNVSMHGELINTIFGEIETLPIELSTIDQETQQKIRNKMLWTFKANRLPTGEEIEKLLKGDK